MADKLEHEELIKLVLSELGMDFWHAFDICSAELVTMIWRRAVFW
jgi:hypothetical protein